MADTENGAIRYEVTALNFSGSISFCTYIDGDIKNEDSNYDEKFWNILDVNASEGGAYLESQTKKSDFRVGIAMKYRTSVNGKKHKANPKLFN